jgi:hypothetical protein
MRNMQRRRCADIHEIRSCEHAPAPGGTRQRNARTPYGKEERSKEKDTEESEAQSQEEII